MHDDSGPLGSKQSRTPEPSTMSGHRILVAEDNEVNRAILIEMLDVLGYPADAVADGLAVVESASGRSYDLILMDCQMPGVDGYEATRRIREAERASGRASTPIVAVSGDSADSDRAKCLEVGMDDLLAKPFTFRNLQAIVMKWARVAGAEQRE